MSYKVTCYCNDANISETSFYVPHLGSTYSGSYGSSSLGEYSEFSVSGFEDSWSVKFTATPATGCSFVKWVYRVGDTSAAVQYNYNSTFTYAGGQDIYIRAEGKEIQETANWMLYSTTLGQVSNNYSDSFELEQKVMYRCSVNFSESGTAKFYSTGSVDTVGYLSTTTGWDDSEGIPTDVIANNDDSDSDTNFSIAYDVKAGVTYYVWVRSLDGESGGNVTLHIEVPSSNSWNLVSRSSGTISSNQEYELKLSEQYTIFRRAVSFSESGTARFYTTGLVDTIGYLTKTNVWNTDTGVPTGAVVSNDDSGSGTNFSISYDVKKFDDTTSTIYYIWVRGRSGTETGDITLHIDVPAAARPNEFSWTNDKIKGEAFNLTAKEWNDFTARINSFRVYKGLDETDFTIAYTGKSVTASMYNQARLAIQEISGYGTYIPTVERWQTITDYMMNILVSELNAIT